MNLAAELRRRQYRYVGVTGSNTLDVLFLTTHLREAVPNARLFMFVSDLMFEHESDNFRQPFELPSSPTPSATIR